MAILVSPAGALIFVLGMVVAMWIGATVSAPIRQRNEVRQYIKQFEEKPLVIQFERSRNVVMREGRSEGTEIGTFRVEVRSESVRVLHRIRLQIVDVVGETKEITHAYQKYIGLPLAATSDPIHNFRAPAEKPRHEVTLAPGDVQIFDLVHITQKGPSIDICHANYERRSDAVHQESSGQPSIWKVPHGGIAAGRLEFVLRAVGESAVLSDEKRFIADATGDSISFHEG